MPADGSTLEPQRLLTSTNGQSPGSWSRDAELIFDELRPGTSRDILALPVEGGGEPRLVIGTEYSERSARLSPDERWLAYQSNVTGQNEIWVRAYPGPGAPVRVSRNGGVQPVWAHSGKELFYIEGQAGDPNSRLMGVSVQATAELGFGSPQVLIDGGFVTYANAPGVYDVSLDDRRFLMIGTAGAAHEEAPRPRINIVLNWFEELKRRVPTGTR
jgi:hypothetical protein